MANSERSMSTEFSLRKPDKYEVRRILINQSRLPDRIIHAEWHDMNGVVVTATIIPNRYKNDPKELQALSNALAGTNIIHIQEVSPLTKL